MFLLNHSLIEAHICSNQNVVSVCNLCKAGNRTQPNAYLYKILCCFACSLVVV